MKLNLILLITVLSMNVFGQTNYFSATVSANSDDAEEDLSDGGIDLTSSDLEMIHDNGVLGVGDKDQWVGIRFSNVAVPKDAIVDSVFLQFTVKGTDSDPAVLQLYGERFFNSSTFADLDFNISSRTRTDSSIYWNVPSWENKDDSGLQQRTPNLAKLFSEVITLPLWQEGNAVTFLIEGSGRRSAFSHDNDIQKAARLHVYYRENTAALHSSGSVRKPSIYPNPSRDAFFIDLSSYSAGASVSVEIFSPLGSKIYETKLTGGTKHSFNDQIKGYNGLLFINIETEQNLFTHRQMIK